MHTEHTHTYTHTCTHAHTHTYTHTQFISQNDVSLSHVLTLTFIPSHSHPHTHTHTHTIILTLSHSHPHTHRQELLSAQDRISHLHDRLAMTRLQSRGSTPSRPSPPDGGDFGGGPHGGPAHYEVYGRHSPTKAAYGGRGLINMTQPHRAASFHEHRNQGIFFF